MSDLPSIGAIVNFCTHDLRFLDKCIAQLTPFATQIIISVCDHKFDGTKEDPLLLEQIYYRYPQVTFVEFAYDKTHLYGTEKTMKEHTFGWSEHWHTTNRLVGYYHLDPNIEWVLFLDVDEIFEKPPPSSLFSSLDAVRLGTYWYFISPDLVATLYPNGPLFVKKQRLSHELLIEDDERLGLFVALAKETPDLVSENHLFEGKPLVHHYSWTRSPEELLQKVRTWGHHWERDWTFLLKEYLANPTPTDFVRGFTYTKGPGFWNPLEEKKAPFHVKKITRKTICDLEFQRLLHD